MQQQFKYRITVEWSDEDGVYVARVPALPGCAAHGDTEAKAAHEARVAAEGILEVMKEEHRRIPASDTAGAFSGKINLRMPRSLHRDLDQLAAAEGVSLNQTMLDLLSRGIGAAANYEGRPSRKPDQARRLQAPRSVNKRQEGTTRSGSESNGK